VQVRDSKTNSRDVEKENGLEVMKRDDSESSTMAHSQPLYLRTGIGAKSDGELHDLLPHSSCPFFGSNNTASLIGRFSGASLFLSPVAEGRRYDKRCFIPQRPVSAHCQLSANDLFLRVLSKISALK
jgi:hypothetical protein